MNRKVRSYPELFDSTLTLTINVLRYCEREKVLNGNLVWLLGLLAGIINSAKSVRILLNNKMVWDVLLISRKIHEAAIDIHYILSASGNLRILRESYALEIAEDRNKLLKAAAARDGMTVRQFLNQHPGQRNIQTKYQESLKEWERLRKASKVLRKKGGKDGYGQKRWMELSWQEKMEGAPFTRDALEILRYVMHQGNSVAHSRPDYLRMLHHTEKNGEVRFDYGPAAKRRYFFNPWNMVIMPMLWATDEMIDHYVLPERFQRSVRRIADELLEIGKRRRRQDSSKSSSKSP